MKNIYLLVLCLYSIVSNAQTFEVETIKLSGTPDKRINLVILGDGYQASEMDKFITDASNFTTEMFSQSPFLEYNNYFNVYAIKTPSNESGADHPGSAFDVSEPASPVEFVDTYFNSTFDGFGFHRLLFYGINGSAAGANKLKIEAVLAENFPTYDQALILVNSNIYGGSGGEFAISSLAPSANEIAIHELGHSLFDLVDEYYPGDGRLLETTNATQTLNATTIKWKNWLNTDNVGIYPYGTTGEAATWYRPHQNCKMRYLDRPFCAVCKEGMIEKIHDLVSPIENFSPNETTVENPEFPLDFEVSLILPTPNTLETVWLLNDVVYANNSNTVTLEDADMQEDENTLSVLVTDNSSLLRIENHETIHVSTVTWLVNRATLSTSITEAAAKNYSISLTPNPANSVLNLKFESNTVNALKVVVTSIDGKRIQELEISKFENTTLNTSGYTSGVYIVNFYDGNVRLASRKFVKN